MCITQLPENIYIYMVVIFCSLVLPLLQVLPIPIIFGLSASIYKYVWGQKDTFKLSIILTSAFVLFLICLNITLLTHWVWDTAAILQSTISKAFSWMKFFIFWFIFQWSLFLSVQLTINQHWFRYWLGTKQVTMHNLNPWWSSLLMHVWITQPQWVNSLRPSDAIWRHRSGSTLAQVMVCCLTAPSHYLNQCWLVISEVQWHSY